jgi:hypothetical protein
MSSHKEVKVSQQKEKLIVYTDHKALIGITTLTDDSKRTVHLWLKLAEFDMTIKHKARTQIAAADALSRHVAGAASTYIYSTEIIECHDELGHRSKKRLMRSYKDLGHGGRCGRKSRA